MSFLERPRFSCVLGGALATITALPDIVPIVHAAQGCAGNLSTALYAGSGYLGAGYCGGHSIPSSNVLERDIVFGGMERLEEEINSTLEVMDGKAFIVTTSCMTEIIGDDIASVIDTFRALESSPPIFHVDTAGFMGNAYTGYEKVIDGLFSNYITARDEKDRDPKMVNIFGVVPGYDPHFRGELEEIARILKKLGIRANTFFTADQTAEGIRDAGRASLNLSFSPVYAKEALLAAQDSHGIPLFVTDLPVGAVAADAFIDAVAERVGVSPRRAAKVKAEENGRYYRYMDCALDIYADSDFQRYAVLVSNSNRVIPYSKYLVDEIGWILRYAFVTDEIDDDRQEQIRQRYGRCDFSTDPKLIFETNTNRIAVGVQSSLPPLVSGSYYDAFAPAFVFGSSLEKELCANIGAGLLTVSYPVLDKLIMSGGYAGYEGGIRLFEDVVSSFLSAR